LQRKQSKPSNDASTSAAATGQKGPAAAPSTSFAASSSSAPAPTSASNSKQQAMAPALPNNVQDAMRMILSNGNPAALDQVSQKMGISTDQLTTTLQALQSGNMAGVPEEVLNRAMNMEHAIRSQIHTNGNMAMALPMGPGGASGSSSAGRPLLPPGHGYSYSQAETSSGGLLDDEEGQNWLVMYRGVYMKYADIVYGPIITLIAAILFQSGLLSLGIALWLLPLMLVAGVRFVLVGLARIPQPLLPYSRLPAGVIASWEMAAELTFIFSMLPYLQDHWLACFAQVGLTVIAYYLHYRAFKLDPGYLELGQPPPPVPPHELAAMQAAAPYHCLTCGIYRPIRSKHCVACGRCTAEFDHHCPVVGNCIGKGNRREFTGYLFILLIAEIMWFKLAVVFWSREFDRVASLGLFSDSVWLIRVWKIFGTLPGTAYMTLLVIAIILGTISLAGRQLFCIVINMTTAELLRRQKHQHFRSEIDGKFFNPFDQGILTNCTMFWQEERPDWYSMYDESRKQGGEILSNNGSNGLFNGWRISSLLKKADDIKAVLIERRERKRIEREEWLIAKYGHVPHRSSGGGGGGGGHSHSHGLDGGEGQHACQECHAA
jgi:DHHC palmitoyltransferase